MPPIFISRQGLEVSLAGLLRQGTCDLLPVSILLGAIRRDKAAIFAKLEALDLTLHRVTTPEQVLVPKSAIGYRVATNLNPIDFLLYTGLVYDYAEQIETFRADDSSVYSARFAADVDDRFLLDNWEGYRASSLALASDDTCRYVLSLDFVDCYNQISTHRVQNALLEAGVSRDVVDCIENQFLIPFNLRASRGIPVGQDAGRLLAESALAMVDQWLLARNFDYVRFVDDIRVFLSDWAAVQKFSADFHLLINRETLKLVINDDKSRVFRKESFLNLESVNPDAREQSERFQRYKDKVQAALEWITEEWQQEEGGPYRRNDDPQFGEEDLSDETREELQEQALRESIQGLFEEALVGRIDYMMIKHLLIKLSARRSNVLIGHVLARLDVLGPVLPLVSRYILSVAHAFNEAQRVTLSEYLQHGERTHLPFYKKWFGDLLLRKPQLLGKDQTVHILRQWGSEDSCFFGIAAYVIQDIDYVRTKKQNWTLLAPSERAWLIQVAHCLPLGERRAFFAEVTGQGSLFEECLARVSLFES